MISKTASALTEDEMKQNEKLTSKQFDALIFVSILSPIIRLFPKSTVKLGGAATWLSPLAALPVFILMALAISRMMKNQPEGADLAAAIKCAYGEKFGGFVLMLTGLWLTAYLGIILRSSAGRLIATIYPNGNIRLFAITILVVSAIIASGKLRSLGRMAEIYMPVAVLVIVFVLAAAVGDFKIGNILPVRMRDAGDIGLGALPMINVATANVYYMFLHTKKQKSRDFRFKSIFLMCAVLLGIMTMTVGLLSSELIEKTQHPFFIMIRNLNILGIIERIEAVIVVLWVISDVIYFASIQKIIGRIFESSFGIKRISAQIGAGVASLAIALFCFGSSFALEKVSEITVPIINMGIIFLILPFALTFGFLRKKI